MKYENWECVMEMNDEECVELRHLKGERIGGSPPGTAVAISATAARTTNAAAVNPATTSAALRRVTAAADAASAAPRSLNRMDLRYGSHKVF